MTLADQARVQHLIDLGRAQEAYDLARSFLSDDPEDDMMLSLLADAKVKAAHVEAILEQDKKFG